MTTSRREETTRVLGVDPGTRQLGYGAIDFGPGSAARLVETGTLRLRDPALPARLAAVYAELSQVTARLKPAVLAVEEAFYGKNIQSALRIGEARGVVLLVAQQHALEICEYAPRAVKKAVTGSGGASKEQVENMIRRLLGLQEAPSSADASDALAVAFCRGRDARFNEMRSERPQAAARIALAKARQATRRRGKRTRLGR